MPQPSNNDLEHLLQEVMLPFYLTKRDMRVPVGRRRLENDVEHSWSLAFLACAMAPQIDSSLDVGKVCQFAIVHDLVELYAGDTTPFSSRAHLASKQDREHQAQRKIVQKTTAFPWVAQTIAEYEQHASNEAKYVWAVDKYITMLMRHQDHGRFFRSIKLTKAKFNDRIAHNRVKAYAHPKIGEYYDALIANVNAAEGYFYEQDTAS